MHNDNCRTTATWKSNSNNKNNGGTIWSYIYLKSELSNMKQFMLIPVCCYCCYYIMLLFLLLICHCASTITDEQQEHYTTTTAATYRYIYINCLIYFSDNSSFDYYYSYVMLLLLLKFICSCTCTRTITGQQQHETVTATTTTQSNLHKLLSIQDVIFPIQQLHMNTSSENMNSFQVWVSVCTSPEKLAKLFASSENLTYFCSLPQDVTTGGIADLSVHFIWQVYLVVHFMWKLDLIAMTISNGLSLKT